MKILFYIDPWIELEFPLINSFWNIRASMIINALGKNAEFSIITGEYPIKDLKETKPEAYQNLKNRYILPDAELKEVFGENYNATYRWHQNEYSQNQLNKMVEIIKSKISDNYTPDIIIQFFSKAPF
ncbi:MAG: hypothetical protein MZU91_05830 [Desulfosudis oleivorans]|nr:hypothetical protein [Desulfosudis oleivorans]